MINLVSNIHFDWSSIIRNFVICMGFIMKIKYTIRSFILLISILIIILTTSVILVNQGPSSKQYIYKEESPYTVSGYMTQDFMEDAVKAINCIPTKLLSQFVKDGWQFLICNTNQAYYGLCDTNNKKVYIYYQQHDATHTVADSVLHEFGHYMDQKLGMISNTEEFSRLYKKGDYIDNSRKDEYCYRNRQELFATIFRDYILRNEYLKNFEEYYDFIVSTKCFNIY